MVQWLLSAGTEKKKSKQNMLGMTKWKMRKKKNLTPSRNSSKSKCQIQIAADLEANEIWICIL